MACPRLGDASANVSAAVDAAAVSAGPASVPSPASHRGSSMCSRPTDAPAGNNVALMFLCTANCDDEEEEEEEEEGSAPLLGADTSPAGRGPAAGTSCVSLVTVTTLACAAWASVVHVPTAVSKGPHVSTWKERVQRPQWLSRKSVCNRLPSDPCDCFSFAVTTAAA